MSARKLVLMTTATMKLKSLASLGRAIALASLTPICASSFGKMFRRWSSG